MAKLNKGQNWALATVLILFIASILFILAVGLYRGYETKKSERLYKGTVTGKYITNAGYRVSAKPYIVFYSDSLKRNITVMVSHNTYNSTKQGDWVGFYLTNTDLKQ